jgi:hypothetical protein
VANVLKRTYLQPSFIYFVTVILSIILLVIISGYFNLYRKGFPPTCSL